MHAHNILIYWGYTLVRLCSISRFYFLLQHCDLECISGVLVLQTENNLLAFGSMCDQLKYIF